MGDTRNLVDQMLQREGDNLLRNPLEFDVKNYILSFSLTYWRLKGEPVPNGKHFVHLICHGIKRNFQDAIDEIRFANTYRTLVRLRSDYVPEHTLRAIKYDVSIVFRTAKNILVFVRRQQFLLKTLTCIINL